MRYKILIIFIWILLTGCSKHNYDEESIILFETNDYLIHTTENELNDIFEKWLEKHKNYEYVIERDKPLYFEIRKNIKHDRNVYKLASKLDKLERLNYKTADLLELKKAYIFNKKTKLDEDFELNKIPCEREFKIKEVVVFSIIDCIF